MKVAFFSNFLNHHQLPICEEFIKSKNVEFVFVALKKTPADRLKMGYEDMNSTKSFVLKGYEDQTKAMSIALSYDIVIFGDSSDKYAQARLEKNKLSFRYIERLFKKGFWRFYIPKVRRNIYKNYLKYKYSNLYILCASGFTSYDLLRCGFPIEKCFAWGYFPLVIKNEVPKLLKLKSSDDHLKILYVGRLLKLKRVIDVIRALKILGKTNNQISLEIIGEGEEESKINHYINKHKMKDFVTISKFKNNDIVRKKMDDSDVLFLGSNFYEGWGAVINEAMNSMCIPLVSHSVGCAPVLIKNGYNGFVYPLGNHKRIASNINKISMMNCEERNAIRINGYNCIINEWSHEVAVKRFLLLADSIVKGIDCSSMFSSGPCSLSKKNKNNWFK